MKSNQVPFVGENVTQTVIYISVIITTLMADSCDPILSHGDTLRFRGGFSQLACASSSHDPSSRKSYCVHLLQFIHLWDTRDAPCMTAGWQEETTFQLTRLLSHDRLGFFLQREKHESSSVTLKTSQQTLCSTSCREVHIYFLTAKLFSSQMCLYLIL